MPRLRNTIFADLPSSGEITAFHFKRSIVGKYNLPEQESWANFWVQRSLTSTINILENTPNLSGYIRRALIAEIVADNNTEAAILALRRSNLPIPPCGELFLVSHKGEDKFRQSQVRRGDTIIINLVAKGDFPFEPNIVFAVKTDFNTSTEPLIVKENIPILLIEDQGDSRGTYQKLNAQIVINPGETSNIDSTKTLFYTCEVVDRQLDEIYTIETGNFTVLADVHNHFSFNR